MRRQISTALLGLVALWGAPIAARAQGEPQLRSLVTERDAVFISVPELISAGVTQTAAWSPDGRYVLAQRQFPRIASLSEPPMTDQSLVVWSDETRRAVTVWSQRTKMPQFVRMEWLHGADVAFAVVTVPVPPPVKPDPDHPVDPAQTVLLRIDAKRGVSRPLGVVLSTVMLKPSPSQPLTALYTFQENGLRILRADGTVATNVRLPEGQFPNDVRWLPDGKSVAVLAPVRVDEKHVTPTWFAVHPGTGALTRLANMPEERPAQPEEGELRVRQGRGMVTEAAARQRISPIWLEYAGKSEEPHALVTANGHWAQLSPRGDAVLYEAEGAAWVAPLLRAPKEAFLQARAAAQRQVVISNAKQAGLAVMMYAQDYDETLPGQDKPILDLLLPYTKSEAVLNGLVYTFPGGKMADIQEPAKTELGYWPGEGGRAVIYADGHVIWRKDGEQ